MRLIIDQDERWPTMSWHEPRKGEEDEVVDVPDHLISDLKLASAGLTLAEQAVIRHLLTSGQVEKKYVHREYLNEV